MKPTSKTRVGSRKVSKKIKGVWTEEEMNNAIHEYDSVPGSSKRGVAKKYGIDESTLRFRINKRKSGEGLKKSGRKSVFDPKTEKSLAKCIAVVCNLGFSPTIDELLVVTSQEMLEEMERKEAEKKEKEAQIVLRKAEREAAKKKNQEKKVAKKRKVKSASKDKVDEEKPESESEVEEKKQEEEEEEEKEDEEEEEEDALGRDQEEVVPDSESEEEIDDEGDEFFQMQATWKYFNLPTQEKDIVGKWYACVYDTKRGPNLYVGKALTRFLFDNSPNSYAAGIEIDCLQQKLGISDNICKETKQVERHGRVTGEDVFTFAVHNIICGPLRAVFCGNGKWDIPEYLEVRKIFERVKKMDRQGLHLAERSKWFDAEKK